MENPGPCTDYRNVQLEAVGHGLQSKNQNATTAPPIVSHVSWVLADKKNNNNITNAHIYIR